VELCDSDILQTLLADLAQTTSKKPSVRAAEKENPGLPAASAASARKAASRQCKCGTCPRCAEDARWERIFREKFADPYYYGMRRVPHNSPINTL
jgi:hypothetical protein